MATIKTVCRLMPLMLCIGLALGCQTVAREKQSRKAQPSAAGATTDERRLTNIAISKNYTAARRQAAILQINDPNRLAYIVKQTDTRTNRLAYTALDRIKDEIILAAIAAGQYTTDIEIKRSAVGRIHDPERLTQIVMAISGNPNIVAEAALLELFDLRDESRLAQIGKSHTNPYWRKRASRLSKGAQSRNQVATVNETDNQKVLYDTAFHHKDHSVRLAAVNRLTEPKLLASLAIRNGIDGSVRSRAVGKLNDQQLLADVAARAVNNDPIRIAAIKKLTNQRYLRQIALTSTAKQGAVLAAKQLDAITDWYAIALKAQTHDVRQIAVANTRDAKFLKSIASRDRSWRVRKAALEKISDATFLERAALNGKHHLEQYIGIIGSRDISVIQTVAKRSDMRGHLAELRLAVFELAENRLRLEFNHTEISKRYSALSGGKTVSGEKLAFTLINVQSGERYKATFETRYPKTIGVEWRVGERKPGYRKANIYRTKLRDLVGQYLRKSIAEARRATLAGSAHTALLRAAALSTISRPSVLRRAAQDSDELVRYTAVNKLSDQAVLSHIAQNDAVVENRIAAVGKLTDRALLRKIVAGPEKSGRVRVSADWRLQTLGRQGKK